MYSNSAKPHRLGFSTIPGSPQEPHEIPSQRKTEPIYALPSNPSSDPLDTRPNMPTIEEHDNTTNSEDDDEPVQTPLEDDVPTECNFWKLVLSYPIRCSLQLMFRKRN